MSDFNRLVALADARGLPVALLEPYRHDSLDWLTTRGQALRFLRLVAEQDERHRGVVPASHTAKAQCAQCGPVLLRPGLVAVMDIVDGVPTCRACPWCHSRGAP